MTMILVPQTVEAALAPLIKVQKGLEAVSNARKVAAQKKRVKAKDLAASANADDDQQRQADAILAKLTDLLTTEPKAANTETTIQE